MDRPLDLEEHPVDLFRHGIVEAHAGTGKTWTIVHRIVLPLLKGEREIGSSDERKRSLRLHVRDLLVVTYTDKAAGELRARIREGLEKALVESLDPELTAHLDDCRKCLGEAWIGTIHSTSLRLLRAYPFESAMPFSPQLVDDPEGLEKSLGDLLREADGPWFSRPHDLRARLGPVGMEALRVEALSMAVKLMDPSSAVDLPDAEASRQNLDRIEKSMDPAGTELVRGILIDLVPRLEALCQDPASRKAKNLLKKWKELDPAHPPRGLWGFSSLKSKAPDLSATDPEEGRVLALWNEVADQWQRTLEPWAQEHSYWEKMVDLSPLDREVAEFVRDWAQGAVSRWRTDKRRRGLLSYADMLGRLNEALSDPGFAKAMRERIKVGIVDEFQDTGRESWEIFRRWFDPKPGDMGGGVLYLVGDPKQSIYSFQGADIQNYLAACDQLAKAGARRYVLRRSFRALPELVEGTNALLAGGNPWFGDEIRYGLTDRSLAVDRPPVDGFRPFGSPPLRVARVQGGANAARTQWAHLVTQAVAAWKGRVVHIPRGENWAVPRPLDWGDFAVVVRGRTQARAFAEAFGEAGIPWALYKHAGVFSSRCAREWAVVLDALGEDSEAMMRLCAITRVLGMDVGGFDPSFHLDPSGPFAGLFAKWRDLSDRGRWAELLESVFRDSGWENRILSGPDPDRQWMDSRQVRTWIQDALRSGEGTVTEIARKLRELSRGDDSDARDANLLQRATDRERVQILTMHAAKGLEFPVVFLGQADTGIGRGPKRTWSWIGPQGQRIGASFLPVPPQVGRQREAEERRLLYVALTRAQLACGVARFADAKGDPRDVLSRILHEREAQGRSPAPWEDPGERFEPPVPDSGEARTGSVVSSDALVRLDLGKRIVRQASFTALVRGLGTQTLEGRVGRSEEDAGAEEDDPLEAWLPKGARTGDALHEILEMLLAPGADTSWLMTEDPPTAGLAVAVRSILGRHGLGRVPASPVLDLLRRVLSTPLRLPGGSGNIRIAEIPARDRRCEVEFHRAVDRRGLPVMPGSRTASWVVGHIDLLFRREEIWYVVDWKSNALPNWTAPTLEDSMLSHAYDLQARLYAHAVRDALPGERFGGCLWIYLRGFAKTGAHAVWTASVGPEEDYLVERALADWLRPDRGSAA